MGARAISAKNSADAEETKYNDVLYSYDISSPAKAE